MTVNQFLLDTYIGKNISFVVEETKNIDGTVTKAVSRRQDASLYEEWEHRVWTKDIQSVDKEFWFRDVKITDKVVEIKQKRNYWILTTLHGHQLELSADDELNIV